MSHLDQYHVIEMAVPKSSPQISEANHLEDSNCWVERHFILLWVILNIISLGLLFAIFFSFHVVLYRVNKGDWEGPSAGWAFSLGFLFTVIGLIFLLLNIVAREDLKGVDLLFFSIDLIIMILGPVSMLGGDDIFGFCKPT
jgi:hypothetical protein